VLVALVTTAMTGPLLSLLKVGRPGSRQGPEEPVSSNRTESRVGPAAI
jgi:hypothetical protein